MTKNNKGSFVDSVYEAYMAFCKLVDSDFHITCRMNANINFEYRADCCYILSCGYFFTNVGVFNSHRQKVSVGEYEDKLFKLAEQRYNRFNQKKMTVVETKMPIKKTSH